MRDYTKETDENLAKEGYVRRSDWQPFDLNPAYDKEGKPVGRVHDKLAVFVRGDQGDQILVALNEQWQHYNIFKYDDAEVIDLPQPEAAKPTPPDNVILPADYKWAWHEGEEKWEVAPVHPPRQPDRERLYNGKGWYVYDHMTKRGRERYGLILGPFDSEMRARSEELLYIRDNKADSYYTGVVYMRYE